MQGGCSPSKRAAPCKHRWGFISSQTLTRLGKRAQSQGSNICTKALRPAQKAVSLCSREDQRRLPHNIHKIHVSSTHLPLTLSNYGIPQILRCFCVILQVLKALLCCAPYLLYTHHLLHCFYHSADNGTFLTKGVFLGSCCLSKMYVYCMFC